MARLQTILKAIPIPLVVTILTVLLSYLAKLTSTSPFYTFLIALVVFICTYIDNYLAKLETEPPAPTPPTPPAPPAAPTPTLNSTSASPDPNSAFTLSVSNMTPNGTFSIIETANGQTLSATFPLDAAGAGSIAYTPPYNLTPLGYLLSTQDDTEIYAQDNAGLQTNSITLS